MMSAGFLLSGPDDAVIWRGPKKNGEKLYFMLFYSLFKENCSFFSEALFFPFTHLQFL